MHPVYRYHPDICKDATRRRDPKTNGFPSASQVRRERGGCDGIYHAAKKGWKDP
jgi:hypothetical protein